MKQKFETFDDYAKWLQTQKPNDYFNDKFLLSVEQVSFIKDSRGLPTTKYYLSSALQYHLEGKGWVSPAEYETAKDSSGLSPFEFN